MKTVKHKISRKFPADDASRWIENRLATDKEFAEAYADGFEEFMVGAMIASAREKAGLTQEALAKRAGTTRSAICRLERQPCNVRLGTLHKLAQALDLHLQIKLA